MSKQIRVRGVRRKEIDSAKLAMAFLMLAKVLRDEERREATDDEQQRMDADRRAS